MTVEVEAMEKSWGGRFAMTIGGRATDSAKRIEVVNPATAAAFATAPDCTPEQLDQAVEAARAAFATWSSTPIDARRELVHRLAELLRANVEELAPLLTREQGKPRHEAEREIVTAAYWCDATADIALETLQSARIPGQEVETVRTPLGVVGAIAPWNHPIALAMFKVAPALVAGNCVILKPSPFTPLTTLRIGMLAAELLPAGVLNVVSGGDDLGPWITAHPGIDKIAFTGSTATGRKVMASAAATLKRVTLELGGNDAAIVLADADPEAIAEGIFWSAFRNSGQACIATKRLYVHSSIHARVRDALIAYARSIPMGEGFTDGVRLGPIQNAKQYDFVRGLLNDARQAGLTVIEAGSAPPGEGYFVPVTIIDAPPDSARIVSEEQFGPVLPILPYDELEDAIARANATTYGLGATLWSADETKARAVAARLDTGTVWINQSPTLSPLIQFGGHGQSGLGVSGAVEGLLQFSNAKACFVARGAMTVQRNAPERLDG